MALPVLDGNQTATTLSSVVTGGEHIVAHSVVCLGSTAIANITNAVSGSVVSISNFPSTQTIAGTVTANVANSVTVGAIVGPLGGSCLQGISPSGDAVRSVLRVRDAAGTYGDLQGNGTNIFNLPIYGTVTIGNSVTIGSLPAISGTVTANLTHENLYALGVIDDSDKLNCSVNAINGIDPAGWLNSNGGDVPVSGTVTANTEFASEEFSTPSKATQIGYENTASDFVFVEEGTNNFPVKIFTSDGVVGGGNASVPISGTVTANNPSGALTTRFGSVTTANTAQITSAVTNTNRKYLLAQNISAGTVTIGIGFSPTTTQGIQLTAGGGLTFDAFCPTGAVYWLGAVTGAAFTILEG